MDLRLNVKKKKNKSCPRRVKEYTRKTMKLGDKNIIFYNNFTIHYINFPIYIYIYLHGQLRVTYRICVVQNVVNEELWTLSFSLSAHIKISNKIIIREKKFRDRKLVSIKTYPYRFWPGIHKFRQSQKFEIHTLTCSFHPSHITEFLQPTRT